jgi:hypothetical protein
MRTRLRSAWTALLDRIPARLPALAASTAVTTAVTPPGALREIAVGVVVIALLSKGGLLCVPSLADCAAFSGLT